MRLSQEETFTLACRVRDQLVRAYKNRLEGVFVFGAGAKGEVTDDTGLELAVVLDSVPNRFAEHERVSDFFSNLSLDSGINICFFPFSAEEYSTDKYPIIRSIKRDGKRIL